MLTAPAALPEPTQAYRLKLPVGSCGWGVAAPAEWMAAPASLFQFLWSRGRRSSRITPLFWSAPPATGIIQLGSVPWTAYLASAPLPRLLFIVYRGDE